MNGTLEDIRLRFCDEMGLDPNAVIFSIEPKEQMDAQIGKGCIALTCFHRKATGEYFCRIGFVKQLLKTDISLEAVAWHEMCHAEAWIEDHRSEGHDDRFQRRIWRKPFYAIWSELIVNFIWPFIR